VISVDTKQKELVGEFTNDGVEYQPTNTRNRSCGSARPSHPYLSKATVPKALTDLSCRIRLICRCSRRGLGVGLGRGCTGPVDGGNDEQAQQEDNQEHRGQQ
jgi:hypothetical protein